jgi:hypothetical protein
VTQAALPADSLRAVLDTVFAAPKYDWVPRADALAWLIEQFRRIGEWFARLETSQPLAYWGLVFLLVAILVAILVHAGFIMAGAMRYSSAPEAREVRRAALRKDGAWYRAEAARLADAGRYAEAVRAQFDAVVLDLDGVGGVRWHPSKTPREYAREAKLSAGERHRLGTLVDGVYSFSYAGTPCGRSEWEEWRASAAGGWRVD